MYLGTILDFFFLFHFPFSPPPTPHHIFFYFSTYLCFHLWLPECIVPTVYFQRSSSYLLPFKENRLSFTGRHCLMHLHIMNRSDAKFHGGGKGTQYHCARRSPFGIGQFSFALRAKPATIKPSPTRDNHL